MVGVPRLELGTSVLSGLRSSQLSYTPKGSMSKIKRALLKSLKVAGSKGYSLKGGNSAADSPTATLLRLSPSHKRYLSHPIPKNKAPSGITYFHGLTGGVCNSRERIHRSMADLRLLANPTS